MTDQIWRHPASGRGYREGDPAHYFVIMARALRQQAEAFVAEYDRRLADRDYLDQHHAWWGNSDADRMVRLLIETTGDVNKAYTAVLRDRDMPDFGLGRRDEEWQRKYGPVDGTAPR